MFLDGDVDLWGNMVALQSFPACGEAVLSRYLEQITGLYTGSDMPANYHFHEILQGLLG